MAKDESAKEGRVAKHLRVAREVRAEPRLAVRLTRDWLVGLWAAKGGGFYGLGVVVTFLILEASTIAGDISGSESLAGFIGGELLEYVFRFGVQSFINGLLAFIWPAFVLERLEVWGLLLLVGGYFVFEYALKPTVENWAPELKAAREARAERRREKRERKAARRRARRE